MIDWDLSMQDWTLKQPAHIIASLAFQRALPVSAGATRSCFLDINTPCEEPAFHEGTF